MKDLKFYTKAAENAMIEFREEGKNCGYIYIDMEFGAEFSRKHDYRPQRVCYYYSDDVPLRFIGRTCL